MIPEVFVIKERKQELDSTFSIRLVEAQGKQGVSFQAGQFNMLYAFGAGEVPVSLSGAPSAEDGWVHTIRAVGPATRALERLEVGDSVAVRGPFGTAWPLDKAAGKDLLVITGGLGLAPLRPVLLEYLAGNSGIKGLKLFYGARNPDDILYRQELADWSKAFDVEVTVDHASAGWQGNVGVVTSLLAGTVIDPKNTVAFVCGPEVMMRFTLQQLLIKKIRASSIYLSMERNMKCATGHCGHCQWGPLFICKDGPVFSYHKVAKWLQIREL